ncbi:MAG: hypothetical protein VZS44_06755 [Bacilli bacterium]|nr:hypothetical protein [Bacilli bacterium]
MKLTREQRNKINDFKNVYMQIFNKDNDDYMRLVIETIFKNVEKNYEEFSDDVHKVSVYDENDGFNILKPYNDYYSLLDFLLNRVFKGIQKISDDENSYEDNERNVRLSKKRYDSYKDKGFSDDFINMQKVKSIMHESGHALQHRTGWFNYKKGFNKKKW